MALFYLLESSFKTLFIVTFTQESSVTLLRHSLGFPLNVPSDQWRCSTLILVTQMIPILRSLWVLRMSQLTAFQSLLTRPLRVSVICIFIVEDFVGLLCSFPRPSFCRPSSSLHVCAITASRHLDSLNSHLSLLSFVTWLVVLGILLSALWSDMGFLAESQSDFQAHLICFLLSGITVLCCLLFRVWEQLCHNFFFPTFPVSQGVVGEVKYSPC